MSSEHEQKLLSALAEWVINFEEWNVGRDGPSAVAMDLRKMLEAMQPDGGDPAQRVPPPRSADAVATEAVANLGAPREWSGPSRQGIVFPPGTGGADVMAGLPVRHIHEMYAPGKISLSCKLVSLYAGVSEVTVPGDWAEFGVYKGRGARFLTQFVEPGRRLHLFDSFQGLPEAWADKWSKGHFDLAGQVPTFDLEKCVIHQGWFSDTAPVFGRGHTEPLGLVHMDADLYSSTMDAFHAINGNIVPGTILLFDEYMMREHDEEHRALVDWAERYSRGYEYLWRTRRMQVAVRVTK